VDAGNCPSGCTGIYDIGSGTLTITSESGQILELTGGTAPEIQTNGTGAVSLSAAGGIGAVGGSLDVATTVSQSVASTLALTLTRTGSGVVNISSPNLLQLVAF